MGIDLNCCGNHEINFSDRNINVIAEEIKEKLNSLHLFNKNYMIILENYCNLRYQPSREEIINAVNKDFNNVEWKWTFEVHNDNVLTFTGFMDFNLDFTEDKIFLYPPSFNYKFYFWFYMDYIERNEWRKYIYQIINLFGGKKVLYLQDYWNYDVYISELKFDEFEKYGKNNFTLDNYKNRNNSIDYFIDSFEGLILKNEISIEEFKKYFIN